MPELPEIEHLRRTLLPHLPGRTVSDVRISRRDVVHGTPDGRPKRRDLLLGDCVRSLHRHGKQLAIEGESGRVICIHLGMSGQFHLLQPREPLTDRRHVHCIWRLERRRGETMRLIFRDPRRFGGIWSFPSLEALRNERWGQLGPDALVVMPAQLCAALRKTARAVKAALLDQSLVAGLGNIYADEALYSAGIHPLQPADALSKSEIARLRTSILSTICRALCDGGTTFRDYRDGNGRAGGFTRHLVYGRAGLPCITCSTPLIRILIAQRSTVFCPNCQPLPPSAG